MFQSHKSLFTSRYSPMVLFDRVSGNVGNVVTAPPPPSEGDSLLDATELCMPRQVALWRPMRSGKKVRAHRSHAISCCTCAFQISSRAESLSAAPPPCSSSVGRKKWKVSNFRDAQGKKLDRNACWVGLHALQPPSVCHATRHESG